MDKYYHIDNIIMEEETVSVIFQKAASGVGIDPGSTMDYIETGSKVELPFWLAHELHLRQAVSVNLASCFDQKTRQELHADSAAVDQRSRCPFFYEFGCKIAPIFGDRTIGFLLLSAFKMYETAQSAMASLKKWRIGGPRFQIASVLSRKRKSME
ncbi:hypothetical protein VNO78_25896 [Psophocarpus tetragonolobus]|uniref:DNA replication complex GINS protein PSF3 N-terminal domain-containing protein n=1 Tax=Psophocarpus tetragonolobus TaxID=3891 RepID=A0AAN9S7A9_PSOTE